MNGLDRALNWHAPPHAVITGPPCAGKTTVADALAIQGYKIVPEIARRIARETIERYGELSADGRQEMSRRIVMEGINVEADLPLERGCVLDRSLADSIAFRRLHSLPPFGPQAAALTNRYRLILMFEGLTFIMDNERDPQDARQQDRIATFIREAYSEAGFEPFFVPRCGVAERLALVAAALDRAHIFPESQKVG